MLAAQVLLGKSLLAVGDSVTVTRVAVSEETTKVALDFATTQVNDPTLEKGKTSIKTKGVPGVREDVVRTTTLNGKVDGTEMVSQTVTQEVRRTGDVKRLCMTVKTGDLIDAMSCELIDPLSGGVK